MFNHVKSTEQGKLNEYWGLKTLYTYLYVLSIFRMKFILMTLRDVYIFKCKF